LGDCSKVFATPWGTTPVGLAEFLQFVPGLVSLSITGNVGGVDKGFNTQRRKNGGGLCRFASAIGAGKNDDAGTGLGNSGHSEKPIDLGLVRDLLGVYYCGVFTNGKT